MFAGEVGSRVPSFSAVVFCFCVSLQLPSQLYDQDFVWMPLSLSGQGRNRSEGLVFLPPPTPPPFWFPATRTTSCINFVLLLSGQPATGFLFSVISGHHLLGRRVFRLVALVAP